jgi:tyrosyl-tRNA synthetase
MIKRDMFQKRLSEGKELYIHEFMYPALQGYDSIVLDVDGEIGGNDQTFNMLFGRDMLKKFKNKDKFVLATKLLTDISGKKMGKTEGNMVALTDKPYDVFGKIMSWSDEMIKPGFELLVSLDAMNQAERQLTSSVNPKDVKADLAFKVVELCFSYNDAVVAREMFEKTFSSKDGQKIFEEIIVKKGDLLSDVLINRRIVSSKSEFWRLIKGGGIEDLDKKEKILDPRIKVERTLKIRVGKKRFLKIYNIN